MRGYADEFHVNCELCPVNVNIVLPLSEGDLTTSYNYTGLSPYTTYNFVATSISNSIESASSVPLGQETAEKGIIRAKLNI